MSSKILIFYCIIFIKLVIPECYYLKICTLEFKLKNLQYVQMYLCVKYNTKFYINAFLVSI